MRVHFLQHVPFEGLGSIEPWLQANGCQLTGTRLFAGEALPDPPAMDMLVIMGGPMSVTDTAQYPWLIPEKELVRQAVTAGKAVLGICLGAQMIASSLGARVYANPEKEIGWWPVQGQSVDQTGIFSFPSSVTVFHWHGETFDLPAGAIRLARSPACANQAFQLGKRVIGLQFHLETTPASAEDLVTHCHHELKPASYVQSATEIRAAAPGRYQSIHAVMAQLLTFLRDS